MREFLKDERVDYDKFFGPLSKSIKYLEEILEKAKEENLEVEIDFDYQWHDGGNDLIIEYYREK